LSLPRFAPADLERLPGCLRRRRFHLRVEDGWRALAYSDASETRLVSRKGNTYIIIRGPVRGDPCGGATRDRLDGEIVRRDALGRPQFYELLRRRGEPVFYAFDVLWIDGKDLRSRPFVERKRILRSIIPEDFIGHVVRSPH